VPPSAPSLGVPPSAPTSIGGGFGVVDALEPHHEAGMQ
jgi:hypothetical protein